MTTLEIVILCATAGVIILFTLFAYEERRGRRVAERSRRRLDYFVDAGIVRWHTTMLYVGSGAARVGVHYLVHRILKLIAALLDGLHQSIERWQRRNRRVVRSVQSARAESHLTAIAAHKHATALSDHEKQQLKEKSLEG